MAIPSWVVDTMGICLPQWFELMMPPVVGLDQKHEVWVDPMHEGEQQRGISVLLQDIRHQQRDTGLWLAVGQNLRFGSGKRRVWQYRIRLPRE